MLTERLQKLSRLGRFLRPGNIQNVHQFNTNLDTLTAEIGKLHISQTEPGPVEPERQEHAASQDRMDRGGHDRSETVEE